MANIKATTPEVLETYTNNKNYKQLVDDCLTNYSTNVFTNWPINNPVNVEEYHYETATV
ncbi:MAG: hypothetical protein WC606_02945 [Candidatus Absconditabacterales bacterium]|jgi:hypothetical protein